MNKLLHHLAHPLDEYADGLQRWRDFSGVSSRRQFWSFMLVSWVIDALMRWGDSTLDWAIYITNSVTDNSFSIGMLTLVYTLFALIPMAAIMVRRLHDADLPGWLALLALIPIGGFPAVVALSLLRSNPACRWK